MVQASLTPQEMYELKTAMWEGADNKELMARFRLSYQIVVGVKAGRAYPHIPWPDGSIGAMSDMRKELLKNSRTRQTVNGKHLDPTPMIPTVPLEVIHSLNKIALEHGFSNINEMERHYKNIAEKERVDRINEEQRLRSEAYEESERIRNLPENVEARRLAREVEPVKHDDLCDPDQQEMLAEGELEGLDIPVVQVAQAEGDKALLLAIRICFKMFSRRQWTQDHVLKNIYSIAMKIENFWFENPLKDPRREYQMNELTEPQGE